MDKIPHERLCPAIAVPFDEYVDAANTGDSQYGWEARRYQMQEIDQLRADLESAQSGTENCPGLQIQEVNGVKLVHCPVKNRSWSEEELKKMEGKYPSLYFAVKMLVSAPDTQNLPVSHDV